MSDFSDILIHWTTRLLYPLAQKLFSVETWALFTPFPAWCSAHTCCTVGLRLKGWRPAVLWLNGWFIFLVTMPFFWSTSCDLWGSMSRDLVGRVNVRTCCNCPQCHCGATFWSAPLVLLLSWGDSATLSEEGWNWGLLKFTVFLKMYLQKGSVLHLHCVHLGYFFFFIFFTGHTSNIAMIYRALSCLDTHLSLV